MKQKGFILITSYMLLSVLSIASLSVFMRAGSFMQATERNKNKIVAFHMAEAGIDFALSQLAADPAAFEDGAALPYADLSTPTVQGGYELSVTIPEGFPDIRRIQARGHAPGNNPASRAYESREVIVFAEFPPSSLFDFAIFAEQSLQLNGNAQTDSYDSRNGPYGGENVGSNGHVGTNSIDAATVTLNGNAKVNGNAEVGPAGDPESVITTTGNAEVTGAASAATALKEYEPMTTEQISQGTLRVTGNTHLELPAGTYRFDSIQITGNGKVTALGPVEIYVDGSVQIAGNGFATQGNKPPNFLLFATGGASIQISGNGNFYGGVYAPHSHVQVSGNGDIYGAVVADTYQQSGNGQLHYDEALNEVAGNAVSGINVKSWQETHTTAWV